MRSATCLQTLHILLSFALKAARKALFLCVINSTSRKPKYLLHSITMFLELVLKIFIRTLVTVNSSDLTSVRFTGHASSAYNKQGKHLSLSKCRTVSWFFYAFCSRVGSPRLRRTGKNVPLCGLLGRDDRILMALCYNYRHIVTADVDNVTHRTNSSTQVVRR